MTTIIAICLLLILFLGVKLMATVLSIQASLNQALANIAAQPAPLATQADLDAIQLQADQIVAATTPA